MNTFAKSLVSHTTSLPYPGNSSNHLTKTSVAKKIANNFSSMSNYSLSLVNASKGQTVKNYEDVDDVPLSSPSLRTESNTNSPNLNEESISNLNVVISCCRKCIIVI